MDIQALPKNDIRVATERKAELVAFHIIISQYANAIKIADDFS